MILKSKKILCAAVKFLPFSVITMLIAALMSGCTSDYNKMRTNHAFEFSKTLEQKTKELVPEDGRLDLEKCVEIALANNLDIRIADIKGRLAGLDRKIAFSYFLPHVDLQYTDLYNDKQQMRRAVTMYVASSDQDITQWVISGQLAVFNPSTWFLYNAYKKGEEIQHLVAERVRQAITLQVTGLYIACLSHEASEKAIVSAVEQAGILVREMDALFREGLILKSELETARLFLASQENRL
ncbi:MAG: TolC family protein [Deltaproteobacteria bacterium]|nr:TolC family protein [Deltaproteobacteria bacterium]